METTWHHAPPHIFTPGGIYMVTAGTLYKAHYFRGDDRLRYLQDTLLNFLEKYGWTIHAWAVFVNHYHWIAQANETCKKLKELIKELHSITAIEINRVDRTPGRQVWFQYWETQLTYTKSWLARLNYVHSNASHHGLVLNAADYPFCSAPWFEKNANPGFRRTVKLFKYDRINVVDDF